MRPIWARQSISARLLRMNVLVSAAALILASVSFLVYDAITFRQNLIHSLETEAQIIGSNSVSALLFDDHDAAKSTLSALHNSPTVVSATILDFDHTPFATYSRDSGTLIVNPPALTHPHAPQEWNRGSQILLGSEIESQGKPVGTVYILADTNEVWQRIEQYVLIALAVLLVCLAVALGLTAYFRRTISGPIVGLATIAQTVTREKDYSLRATAIPTEDEVSVLVQSFNEMLRQIQDRDRALSASRDVLEQRVHERTAELQAANKELEAFSYSVAHDLRGPLDTLGNVSFVLRNMNYSGLDQQTQELLQMLPRTTARMSSLIDDLLNLSRAKSAPLHLEPIDLTAMAQGILDDLQKDAPERSTLITVAPHVHAIADQGLMRVVFSNLLGNAWKYTSKTAAATIEFGVLPQDNQIVYFVRDNGAGFDPYFKDRLFKPFERLHTQSEFSGTGIGLATVHRIIVRHGGSIWAEGQINHGATFYFTLA